jgi:hypothetical protein
MAGSTCGNTQCNLPLDADDVFCGSCGTPAPRSESTTVWPGTTRQYDEAPNGQRDTAPSPAGAAASFFSHEPRRPRGPLSNSTRYLCAAAYLDNEFANRVIRKLLATRRAVAPSLNVDIGPVISHCQRARRNLLIRNIALVAIVVVGLIASLPAALSFLSYAFLLGWLVPRFKWRQRRLTEKILLVFVFFGAWTILGLISFAIAFAASAESFTSAFGSGNSLGSSTSSASGLGRDTAITFFLMLGFAWATEAVYNFLTFRILIEHLRLGAPPPSPAHDADGRIAMVEGAQWGNITLYATEDPFIGAGVESDTEREWSIAIRLNPADPARQLLHKRPAADKWVPIDPVEVHQAIREKLRGLNDPRLPANERINSLSVSDRLVGAGLLRWDSPLVDASKLTPYSRASQEAVQAVIRHPQARLRYYQHVVVNDEGPPVTVGDQIVLEGADQGISISAFVYTAVEGRHFYLQFILTALPPIKPEYRIIDLLPTLSSGKMLLMVLGRSFKRFFAATAGSVPGIVSTVGLRAREQRIEREILHTGQFTVGKLDVAQLGAEVSVRELGMDDHLGSFIHVLDVEKYNSIIARAVLETVQDFLAGKGVDVSAFTDSAVTVINGNVIGSVSGGTNQFGGAGSHFSQRQPSGSST